MKQIELLIERISALRRNVLKSFGTSNSLPLVQVEILQYLSICNRYSDTAQVVGRYLGQTKGTISQSISELEKNGILLRKPDKIDKRIVHLILTKKGVSLSKRLNRLLEINGKYGDDETHFFESLLQRLQMQNGFVGFGLCSNCKFNRKINSQYFFCELTKEKLAVSESQKICNEYSSNTAVRIT